MMQHQEQWIAPAPLWAGSGQEAAVRAAFAQPAILRFASDAFMEDVMRILAQDPLQLNGFIAQPETWRGPMLTGQTATLLVAKTETSALARKLDRLRVNTERLRKLSSPTGLSETRSASALRTVDAPPPLKLYQPAHQRHYLVSACLICQLKGLPDRVVDEGQQERAFYVLRRLLPTALPVAGEPLGSVDAQAWDEYAFIVTPTGNGWQKLGSDRQRLADGEEELALFGLNYTEDDGRSRRLLAGVIPVGKREQYMGAGLSAATAATAAPPTGTPPVTDPRVRRLYTELREPWKRLLERAAQAHAALTATPGPDTANPAQTILDAYRDVREQLQTVSWYMLLDFAKYLREHFPNGVPAPLTTRLQSARYQARTFAEALSLILPWEQRLENEAAQSYKEATSESNTALPWPNFRFAFADAGDGSVLTPSVDAAQVFHTPERLQEELSKVDEFVEAVRALLPPLPARQAAPLATQMPLDMREGWFVLRCIWVTPNCGPLHPPLVSAASAPFQMAGFFDPDAPARPIRIALPLDTTPAGLRKFDKNTAFMISDVLCGQLDRVRGLTLGDLVLSVLPWPFHKDLSVPDGGPCAPGGLPGGEMCSFSLPIITLCALIMLIVIVSLLDLIFRWLPFFSICFPLPGFTAGKRGNN
ncbi:MAG: hypothetical protein HY011_34670 [Acidobacteria bacterium]|nr:hypothetical protein [Acidobacteriota bacterium]